MIFIWRQKKNEITQKKEITMRWWWCIMHDVYLLLFEAWITISVCGAPGKIIGKISLPFSVGSLSYPKKVEDCRADPVNLWGPRNLLFVCALMHTSISTPYQYFLIFWPSNICLHFPHSPNYDPECSPWPTYPILSSPCFSALRTFSYITLFTWQEEQPTSKHFVEGPTKNSGLRFK